MDDVSDEKLKDHAYALGAFITGAAITLFLCGIFYWSQTADWELRFADIVQQHTIDLNIIKESCDLKIRNAKFSYKQGVKRGERRLKRVLDMELGEVYLDRETGTQWSRFNDSSGRQYLSFVYWPTDRELKILKRFSPLQIAPQGASQERPDNDKSAEPVRKEKKK